MKKHYFLLDAVEMQPHAGLMVQKEAPPRKKTVCVDNMLSHFEEFSYNNFYNTKNFHILEKDSYKFILNFIHMPNKTDFVISQKSVDMLNSDPNAFLVLMSCLEHVITPEELVQSLKKLNIQPSKTIVLCSNIDAHGQILNGVKYICVNFWESYSRFHHKTLLDIPVANASEKFQSIATASKKYICLNRNVKPHRIWLYYAIIKSNMIDQGHVSYHLPKEYPSDYKLLSDSYHVTKRIPAELHNDFKIVKARKMYPRMLDHIDKQFIINYRNDIQKYYDDSLLNIITESDCVHNFITEKTYKAFANLQPYFIVGNPDMHRLLNARGYHTFENLFGVESVTDYNSGIAMLENIKAQNIHRLKKTIRKEYFDKLIHNQQHFFNRQVKWSTIVKEIFHAVETK